MYLYRRKTRHYWSLEAYTARRYPLEWVLVGREFPRTRGMQVANAIDMGRINAFQPTQAFLGSTLWNPDRGSYDVYAKYIPEEERHDLERFQTPVGPNRVDDPDLHREFERRDLEHRGLIGTERVPPGRLADTRAAPEPGVDGGSARPAGGRADKVEHVPASEVPPVRPAVGAEAVGGGAGDERGLGVVRSLSEVASDSPVRFNEQLDRLEYRAAGGVWVSAEHPVTVVAPSGIDIDQVKMQDIGRHRGAVDKSMFWPIILLVGALFLSVGLIAGFALWGS